MSCIKPVRIMRATFVRVTKRERNEMEGGGFFIEEGLHLIFDWGNVQAGCLLGKAGDGEETHMACGLQPP